MIVASLLIVSNVYSLWRSRVPPRGMLAIAQEGLVVNRGEIEYELLPWPQVLDVRWGQRAALSIKLTDAVVELSVRSFFSGNLFELWLCLRAIRDFRGTKNRGDLGRNDARRLNEAAPADLPAERVEMPRRQR